MPLGDALLSPLWTGDVINKSAFATGTFLASAKEAPGTPSSMLGCAHQSSGAEFNTSNIRIINPPGRLLYLEPGALG